MPTFTAMYENRADAERIQAQLEQLGIIDTDGGHGVHDKDSAGFFSDESSSGQGRGVLGRLPDEDRHTYEEGVRRGHFLLTVNTDDESADRVHEILESSNAVDVDEKSSSWKSEGWTAPAAGAATGAAFASSAGSSDRSFADTRDSDEQRIPIVEEQLAVGKREVNRGGVRVRSFVNETPVQEQVNLREEHVHVERHAVNEPLRAGDLEGDAFRERDIELTETAEEAVVAKNARVVEEVIVSKDVESRTETVSDTVRRTDVDVEQLGNETTNHGTGLGGTIDRDSDRNR